MIEIAKTIPAVRALVAELKAQKKSVALVPTMGALHDGHLSLVTFAQTYADAVIVSIFVNPTQFAANEDLSTYPRDLDGDLAKLATVNTYGAFLPTEQIMYPDGFSSRIEMDGPAKGLEADFRPTHFSGVATVVAKLLLSVGPDVAVFGEKDFQQLQVIKRLVADFNIPVRIFGAPTLRADSGLALSSRNAYLSEKELATAPELNKALRLAAKALCGGKTAHEAEEIGLSHLKEHGFVPDYLAVREATNLQKIEKPEKGQPLRLLTAARLGKTRLIDNIGFETK